MATKIGRLSAPDKQGHYARQLGWKRSTNGKKIQHKFRLGRDRSQAEVREVLLRRIWKVIEQENRSGEALWDDVMLEIARQVAVVPTRLRLPCRTNTRPHRPTEIGSSNSRIGSGSCVSNRKTYDSTSKG